MRKILLLLTIIALAIGCKNDEHAKPFQFEAERLSLDSTNIKPCMGKDFCPDVEVEYLKIKGNSDFAQAVNEKNAEDLIAVFNASQKAPTATSVQEAVDGFVADYFKFREDYPDSPISYEALVEQKIKSQNARTLVIKTSYYLFTGGAHGYGGVHFLNFDAHSGKYLTHKDLFSDLPAFTAFAEKKFRQHYDIPPEMEINAKGFFFEDGKFALPENIAVTDKAVILLYNPYEAASYAQSQLRFVFPRKEVVQWLNY